MSDVRKLAKIVSDHSRQIKGLSGGPQAAYSSIEGGSMDSYDSDGKLRLRIGAQDDGTQGVKYVQGPPPPRPTAPVVSVDGPVVRVRWDGMLLGGHIPEDFARIDVHFALASDDLEDEAAVRGNLATSAGNETVLAATQTGTYRVGLVAMSQSRARSEMSEVVDVDVTLVDIEGALDAVVENARGGSNHYSPEPPSGTDHDPDRDLWFDTSEDAEGLVSYSPHRWDADLQEWVSVADQRTAALQDALGDFEGTVEQRFTDAGDRIDGLETSLTELDSTTLPGLRQDLDAAEGRLGEAEGQITDAFGQLEVIPGQIDTARQEAIDAAQQELDAVEGTLQSSIDAKRDITWSTSGPPVVYDGPVGSTWFKMSGNGSGAQVESQWRWQGDVWVSTILSAAVLAKIDIGEGTFGTLDGIRLKAGSVQASSVAVGDFTNLATIDPVRGVNVTRPNGWRTITVGDYTMSDPDAADYLMFKDRTDTVPVNAGDSLRVAFKAKATEACVAQFRLWAYENSSDGSSSGQRQVASPYITFTEDEQQHTTTINIPTDFGIDRTFRSWIMGLVPASYSTMQGLMVRDVSIYRMTGSTLIQNGAILTEKLAADVLEVGNLKAGAGEIAELVSRKIAAATGQFLELDVGQLTVTEQSRLADVVAEQIAADAAQFMELEVGKLVASEGILDEAVIKQLFAEVVVSQMSFADEFIGGNAILEGSITAESGIIGSIDAGVINVGEMNGARIEAGTIDTPQLAFGAATGDILSVDALNFKRAVGLDLSAPSIRVGDAMELTEDFGIRQFGPDGALNVSLPSDGSEAQFRGDLSAKTLTATGRMSIQGPGAVASGGVLELESGVVPPVAGPQITNAWQRATFPPVGEGESPWGLAWADGHWWRAVQTTSSEEGATARLEKITTDGELVLSFPIEYRSQVNGITVLGDTIYVLGWPRGFGGGDRYVLGYDYAGNEVARWVYPNYGSGTYQPAIGNDGTNIVIVQSGADGQLTWRKFNPSTGATLSRIDAGSRVLQDAVGIHFGDFDYGARRMVLTLRRQSGDEREQFLVYEDRAGASAHRELPWFAANMDNPVGSDWVDGRFYSLGSDGHLYSYESHEGGRRIGDNEDDSWGAVTWATGSQETTAGPATRFRYLHRSQLRVQNGDVPQGVEKARFYTGKGATEPDRTGMRWVATFTQPYEPSRIPNLPADSTGVNPPAQNTFTNDVPGEIRSAIGGFRVDGTGAGQWGPLTFHADGSMTSDQIPEWIPVTTFTTGFGPQTWGFVPAYRIWPDGKVEWRGVIAGTINGTVTPFTIPAEARPAQPVNKAAAAWGDAGTSLVTRIEFGSVSEPDKLRVYRGDSDRMWVSLDDTYYYHDVTDTPTELPEELPPWDV